MGEWLAGYFEALCVVLVFVFCGGVLLWLGTGGARELRKQKRDIKAQAERIRLTAIYSMLTRQDFEFLSRGMPVLWLDAQVGAKNAAMLRALWYGRGRHKGTQQAG
jgi:hypothetical protein